MRRVDASVTAAVEQSEFVAVIIEALDHNDIVARVRAADALAKVQRQCPSTSQDIQSLCANLLSTPAKGHCVGIWHRWLLRVSLSPAERLRFVKLLRDYFSDSSAYRTRVSHASACRFGAA